MFEWTRNEREFFAKELMMNNYGIFSPYEYDEDVDFPKKDELGGVVLRFIGGGAAYLKIQTHMPSEEEVKDIHNVGKFLMESFGEYVVISVLCTPDIEIYDINVDDFVDMHVDFASARKSNGDLALKILTEKLKCDRKFTEEDHYWRFLLPFMGHKDYKEFERKFSEFLELYNNANMELPEECNLDTYNVWLRMLYKK